MDERRHDRQHLWMGTPQTQPKEEKHDGVLARLFGLFHVEKPEETTVTEEPPISRTPSPFPYFPTADDLNVMLRKTPPSAVVSLRKTPPPPGK